MLISIWYIKDQANYARNYRFDCLCSNSLNNHFSLENARNRKNCNSLVLFLSSAMNAKNIRYCYKFVGSAVEL